MIAHLWVCHPTHESWVKIRLTSKHTVDEPFVLQSDARKTDEGFSSVEESLWLEDDGVHRCLVEDSRDCDGRYHNHVEHLCKFDALEAGGSPDEYYEPTGTDDDGWRLMSDVKKPLWVEIGAEYNDYTAQAANY